MLTTAVANATLDALHPSTGTTTVGSLTITAPMKVRLMTVVGSAGTAGTELSAGGSSYAPGTGLSIGTNWAAAVASSKSTSAVVQQINMPTTSGSGVVGIELWDSGGTAQRVELGSIAPKSTVLGDTLSFTSGSITSAFA